MLSCMQRGMDPDTLYCSPDPLFDEITEVFLDTFGTNTIPAGYVKGDSYGPKTNRQDFAKLFRVFYILIILAVLCVLVLIMMIIFLVWYYKRRNYEAKSCSKIKFWSLFIIILLLLSLILSASADLHRDLGVNSVVNELTKLAKTHEMRLIHHVNEEASRLIGTAE